MVTDNKAQSRHISVFRSPEAEAAVLGAYQRVFEAWPVDFEERYVSTSFGETHVIVSGRTDGPPLVLLHGMFATATAWYRNVEELGRVYRVYCVDVIGEANPSRPSRSINSLDEAALWFTEFLDALMIDDLHLAGNSFGGFLSAYFAMKLPERVRKLVLIAPASTIHGMRPFVFHVMLPVSVFQFAHRLPHAERLVDRAIDWMNADMPKDPLWSPLFVEVMKKGRLINKLYPRVFAPEELAEIAAPVLLVFGDHERIYGDLDSAVRAGKRLMPDCQVAVIPGANHITALTQPEATNRALLRFLAD